MRFLPILAVLFFARSATAGELTYDAPTGCPSRDDVAGRVAARAPDARDGVVVIRKKGGVYAAHLTIGGREDALERDVEGRTCDAVVNAAVLVLALDRPAVEPSPPVAAATSVAAEDEPTAAPVEPRVPPPRPIAIAVGVDAVARQLSTAEVTGGLIFGELDAPGLFAWKPYRPSVRIGGTYVTDSHGARFGGGTLNLCPVGIAFKTSTRTDLTLAACGVFDAGSARDPFAGSFFDAGGAARATLEIGRSHAVRGFIDLSIGLVARLGAEEIVSDNAPRSPSAITIESGGFAFPLRRTMGVVGIGGGVAFP